MTSYARRHSAAMATRGALFHTSEFSEVSRSAPRAATPAAGMRRARLAGLRQRAAPGHASDPLVRALAWSGRMRVPCAPAGQRGTGTGSRGLTAASPGP
jgi:hypothetical protein